MFWSCHFQTHTGYSRQGPIFSLRYFSTSFGIQLQNALVRSKFRILRQKLLASHGQPVSQRTSPSLWPCSTSKVHQGTLQEVLGQIKGVQGTLGKLPLTICLQPIESALGLEILPRDEFRDNQELEFSAISLWRQKIRGARGW